MLPAAHRLTDGDAFRTTVRNGRRAGSRTVVVHLAEPVSTEPVRVGFVVGKAVGGAVRRNRVRRQLQHCAAEHLADLPAGARLVVRAQRGAAEAGGAELRADLDRCLGRVLEVRS